jgi:hypothetical protein
MKHHLSRPDGTLKRLIDDPAVEVLPLEGGQTRPVTPPSRLDTEMLTWRGRGHL